MSIPGNRNQYSEVRECQWQKQQHYIFKYSDQITYDYEQSAFSYPF